MDKTKRSFWVSYVMYKDKAQGFGNSIVQVEDTMFHAPTIGALLARQVEAEMVIILYWTEVPNEQYDQSLARDASILENQQEK